VITITAVKVTLYQKEQIRGYAALTIDDSFVVRGLKIIQGADGRLFTAMPSRKRRDGSYQDLAHPVCREAREVLETAVQAEYARKIRARGVAPDCERERQEVNALSPIKGGGCATT
jgi:stage V sporulation protein G